MAHLTPYNSDNNDDKDHDNDDEDYNDNDDDYNNDTMITTILYITVVYQGLYDKY